MPKFNKKKPKPRKSRCQPRGKPGPTICEWVYGWPIWGAIRIICL